MRASQCQYWPSQPLGLWVRPVQFWGSQEARESPSLCLRSHPPLTPGLFCSQELGAGCGTRCAVGGGPAPGLGCMVPGVRMSPGFHTAGPWGHQVPELKGGEHSGHLPCISLSSRVVCEVCQHRGGHPVLPSELRLLCVPLQ